MSLKMTLKTKIPLSKTDENVLKILQNNPNLTRKDISKRLNLTVRTIQRSLDKLVKNNLILRMGSKKIGYWEILK